MLPAPMTEPLPMVTPGKTMEPAPIHTPSSITTGAVMVSPSERSSAGSGWVAVDTMTLGAMRTWSPIVMVQSSSRVVL